MTSGVMQCARGDVRATMRDGRLARQISENGLKKLQTGGLAMFKQLPPACLLGKALGFPPPKVE